MEILDQIAALRTLTADWRRAGLRIALVPTMGNLHAGHLELVRVALTRADRVITSSFVNPLQFGPAEDFARYPRTPWRDAELLRAGGCHCLFAPDEAEVYPRGRMNQTRVEVPILSDMLCGATRPGHFAGVATVVAKLFNMAQPDLALFGEKDFQQLLIIRRLAADLNLPIEVVGVPIVREPDGLALSSRNAYLTEAERAIAPRLHATLREAATALLEGRSIASAERDATARLRAAGFQPDYFCVRRRADLGSVGPGDRELVIVAAAALGKARLIDNLIVELPAALPTTLADQDGGPPLGA